MNITNYLMAGFQVLFFETQEIKRCVYSIEVDPFINDEPTHKEIWNMMDGRDPMGILEQLESLPKFSILVLENFNFFLGDDNPMILQKLLNMIEVIKYQQKMIIIVGTDFNSVPKALEKIVCKIEFNLPDVEVFKTIVRNFSEQVEISITEEEESAIAESCKGLSYIEAENAISASLVERNQFDRKEILKLKREMIRKSGFMDIHEPEPIENLKGLTNLVEYLFLRKEAWKPDSIKPKLRSLFLTGIPGTGKTLTCRVMASIFNCPLIILDLGALKGSLVGQTEQNIRSVTKIIDGVGFCVVLIDEIEKTLGGASSNLDSGVTIGMVGHLLTWMQERKSEGILAATSNDVSMLPPELLRAERWDGLWFVDVPTFDERKEIIKLKNKQFKSELPTDDNFINQLNNWTGAEISQLAKESHFYPIEKAIQTVPVLYKTRPESLAKIREKCKGMNIANGVIEIKKEVEPRKVTVSRNELINKLVMKKKLKRKE